MFGEDGSQERCRAAETTRTPRASTYSGSTTFGRNPAPLLLFKCSATLFREVCSGNRPDRKAGSVLMHDDSIVHGVTAHTRGVRYSLFLLEENKVTPPLFGHDSNNFQAH